MAIRKILDLPLKWHLLTGFIIRLVLILYGEYHDRNFELPFTDVDYRVFTDAARYVLKGESPYKRHTYRYSPIIAYLMVPNIILTGVFGKFLFSVCDLLVTVVIRKFVELHLKGQGKSKVISQVAQISCLFWLYNPMSIAISTRGNADSFPSIFIILSILFLQTNLTTSLVKYILSGIFLGISIHLRIYPIVFSLPMYLSLGGFNKITRSTSLTDAMIAFLPNRKQLLLAFSCVATLALLTYGMYILYGYDFLFETYIYHLFRKDVRHNFSVLFYYTYLTYGQFPFDFVKTMCSVCEGIILFLISLKFGCDSKTLPFALFCQSVVLVAYNSVMTSQYFIWFLSLLPLIIHNLKIPLSKAIALTISWLFSQAFWLYYAYELEFKSEPVLFMIGFAGISFFITNTLLLSFIIKNYKSGYGYGKLSGKSD